jgi:hypothetical protein
MRPGHTQTLVVASQNPVKIEATRRGFASVFPRRAFHLHPVAVPSGVRPQPLSDAETWCKGTEQGTARRPPGAALITGWASKAGWRSARGVWKPLPGLWSQPPLLGKSRTGTFSVPEGVAALVRQGVNSLRRSRRCISTRR